MTNTISSTKCPSTLTSGKYGMSQHLSIIDNSKEYIFVKLTDSALRSIEEYQCALQARRLAHGQRARIQFIGNGGIIHFPTGGDSNGGSGGAPTDGRKFGFAIDDVEGSLECIQQSGTNLDVLGSLNCRMRIHANDDIYDTTRTKMAIAEETEKSKCIREIKPNQTDIGRKVKRPLSSTSTQVYATNSGMGSSNNSVSVGGNGSNLSNSKISRNKVSPFNNYSPQSQSVNGNNASSNTNSTSALLHSSSTSTRLLKVSPNAHTSSSSTFLGGSSTTIDNINNRCYSGSSNSSLYTGQSPNASFSAASTLSSTLAGGVTTGYQSALSNSNFQSSMLDLGDYPSNCKTLSGGGNNSNNNNNPSRSNSNSLCRSGKGLGRGSGSLFSGANKLLDVSRRKLRERLIHLLALKPFKKPELFARLQNEGLSKRDRNNITNLLNDISTLMRDNTYNLKHNLWNNVDENWQYFTEQERQQLKRRKPQNLTPPNSSDAGSTTSGQSPTSHTGSPPPQTSGHGMLKRIRLESGDLYEGQLSSSGSVHPKKQRISHYKKNALETKIFPSNTTTTSTGIRTLGSTGCYNSNNNSDSSSTYNVFQQSRNSSPYSPQIYNNNINNINSSGSSSNNNGNLLHIDDDHLSFKFSSSITENNSCVNGNDDSNKKIRNRVGTACNGISNKAAIKKDRSFYAIQDGLTSRRNNTSMLPLPYTQNFVLGSQDRHSDDKSSSSNGSSNNSGECTGTNRVLHSQQKQKTLTLSNHTTYGHNNNNNQNHNNNNASCSNDDVEVVTSGNYQYNNNCTNNNSNTGSSSRRHHSPIISDSRKHLRSSTPSQTQLMQKRNRINNSNNNNSASSIMSNKRHQQNNFTSNASNGQFSSTFSELPSSYSSPNNIDTSDCTSDVVKLQMQQYNKQKQPKQQEQSSPPSHIKRKQSLPTEQEIADVANSFSIDTQGTESMPYDFSNYTTITTVEQRRRYRSDFESEYDEYLELSEKIGKVQTRFRDMGERMASLQPDCRDYHKIKNQIIQEYENLRKEQESINKNNERLNYLGAKLGYIKQLVAEFDKKVKMGEIRITPTSKQIAEETHRHHQHYNQNPNQNLNQYQHHTTQVMNVPPIITPAATTTFTSTHATTDDSHTSYVLQTDTKAENDCCPSVSPLMVTNNHENALHLKYQDLQSQQRQPQQQQQQQHYYNYRPHNNHCQQKQHSQQHHQPETIAPTEDNHHQQLRENSNDNSVNNTNNGGDSGNKCSNYQLNQMHQSQLHHHHKQQQQQQQQQIQYQHSPLQNYSNSETDSDNDSSSSSSSDGSDDDEDCDEEAEIDADNDNIDIDDDDDNSNGEGNNSNNDNSNDDYDDDTDHHHNHHQHNNASY